MHNKPPTSRRLIVCADDFGISKEISDGIILGHTKGIITSTALLMNAPYTQYAVELSKNTPSLEVGLHLSVVEGYCLSGTDAKTLLDRENYFNNRPCLHKNWKQFLSKFLRRQISMIELEREFRLQIESFLLEVGRIPFLNSTQHLHFLPRIGKLVLALCAEYGINNLRLPINIDRGEPFTTRKMQAQILKRLSQRQRKRFFKNNPSVDSPDLAFGFVGAGGLTKEHILNFLDQIGENEVAEIMAHPGFDSPTLRQSLPKSYENYNWQGELNALLSHEVKERMKSLEIELDKFNTREAHERVQND